MNPKFEELRKNWMDFEEFKERFQKVEVEEYPNNVLKAVPKPEISVHIITYQHAPYIREAIESVLMQKVDVPWEIIIGDDESTDGTREICIEYAEKYPDLIRLFLHKRENNIAVLGKPCGIFQIVYNTYRLRGKYKAVISGDDYWTSKNKLKAQFEYLENNACTAYVSLPYISRQKKGDTIAMGDIERNLAKASSVMYRNYFVYLPKEFLYSLNEDMFFQAIAKLNGGHEMIENAGNIVYNNYIGNLWNSNNSFDKKVFNINNKMLFYLALGSIEKKYKFQFAEQIIFNKRKKELELNILNIMKFKDIKLFYYIIKLFIKKYNFLS